jgi:hypothetical protein
LNQLNDVLAAQQTLEEERDQVWNFSLIQRGYVC